MLQNAQTLGLCWGTIEDGSLFDLAETAASVDVHGITATPRQYFDQVRAGVSDTEIRNRLSDLDVAVSIIDPLISALPGTPRREDVDERFRWMLEASQEDCWRAAEALGAQIINLGHFMGAGVSEAELGDALARIAEQDRAQGFGTTIEFVAGTGVPDLVTAGRMTRGLPDLKIMFDCWHFVRSNGKVEDIDSLPPGSFGGAQVNDWLPPAPGQPYIPMSGRLMPGDGCLPIADILKRIQRNSPGLEVGIEVFNADLRLMGWGRAANALAERTRPLLAR